MRERGKEKREMRINGRGEKRREIEREWDGKARGQEGREGGGRDEKNMDSRCTESPKYSRLQGPALFTIISDTDRLILILLVKKYLSRYKNKPTANYKLSGLKIYSCLCGGG